MLRFILRDQTMEIYFTFFTLNQNRSYQNYCLKILLNLDQHGSIRRRICLSVNFNLFTHFMNLRRFFFIQKKSDAQR